MKQQMLNRTGSKCIRTELNAVHTFAHSKLQREREREFYEFLHTVYQFISGDIRRHHTLIRFLPSSLHFERVLLIWVCWTLKFLEGEKAKIFGVYLEDTIFARRSRKESPWKSFQNVPESLVYHELVSAAFVTSSALPLLSKHRLDRKRCFSECKVRLSIINDSNIYFAEQFCLEPYNLELSFDHFVKSLPKPLIIRSVFSKQYWANAIFTKNKSNPAISNHQELCRNAP